MVSWLLIVSNIVSVMRMRSVNAGVGRSSAGIGHYDDMMDECGEPYDRAEDGYNEDEEEEEYGLDAISNDNDDDDEGADRI